MLRFRCSCVAAALILGPPVAAFAADPEPVPASNKGSIVLDLASHQLFLRELAAMASRETRADVRLSDDQLNKLRAIQAEHRAAIANMPSKADKAREKVNEAQNEIDAARAAKLKLVEEMQSKIDAMQAQLDKLRLERDALKGQERIAKKQQIDSLRAELDSLRAKFQSARDEANAEINQAQENKGDAVAEKKQSAQSQRSAFDQSRFRARMIEILTPAQRAALDKRLAEAEEAIKLIDPEYSIRKD